MNANKDDILALEDTIKLIEANRNDADVCVEQDLEFHSILLKASKNVVFEIMLLPVRELLRESRMETIQQGVDHVIVGHKAVLKAVRARNPERAATAMLEHLDLAEDDLRRLLGNPKKTQVR